MTKYMKPELEIKYLEIEVITTSGDPNQPIEGPDDGF